MSLSLPGAPVTTVTDAADPRLDDFRDLMAGDVDPARRAVVIAEGVNVVERLLRSPYRVRRVVGVASKLDALAEPLRGFPGQVCQVDKWTLSDAVGFRVTRGVMASVDRPVPLAVERVLAGGSRFVVLETINDFENLGSLFRNAAGFGLDGVLLDARCADPLYRRSVRVSMGHVFGMPFAVLPDPFDVSLGRLQADGISVLALTPRAVADPLREVVAPRRWAVMLGAEGPGLSEAALAAADRLVRIPMADGVDSLNVATAGAIAFAALV